MPGFGLAPWGGSSMWGYGTIDATDPRATVTIEARAIDPGTHDYTIEGRAFKASTPVRQQMVIAIASAYGSGAAVPKLGLNLKGEIMNTGFEARMRDKVRLATRHLTEVRKTARITEIVVTKASAIRGYMLVVFEDLTSETNKPETLKIPFRVS